MLKTRTYALASMVLWMALTGLILPASSAWAQEPAPAATEPAPEITDVVVEENTLEAVPPVTLESLEAKLAMVSVAVDTVWVMVAAMLVFFMNLGFGCIEAGMCRAKNCVNIVSKNFFVFAVSTVAYWVIGWGLMFGNGTPWVGTEGLWFVSGVATDNSPAMGDAYSGPYSAISWAGVPLWTKFFFQLVFCGTAATIVSGAVAERIKYHSFIIFSVLLGMLVYPVVGHWIWGGGWLAGKGFLDFAGSTQVHSLGGWAALTGILFLGPRIGKFTADGKISPIPGHSMSLAFIGCMVLWFGWFGFNPGSTMSVAADGGAIAAHVAVTTNTAAAFATISATVTAWLILGKPDVGMTLNGCLAGLVAITAGCAFVTVEWSAIIGLIAGVLVVLSVMMFDRVKIDDPVGATSVHLVNGIFGTLCIGLVGDPKLLSERVVGYSLKGGLIQSGDAGQLVAQLTGIIATAVFVVVATSIIWLVIRATVGLRVSQSEELEGLDLGEHGNDAYYGFVMQAPAK